MTAAIFALAGVIVGAVASGFTQLLLERRRESQQLLVAVRIVHDEVAWLHAVYVTERSGREMFGPEEAARGRAAVDPHLATLARHLTPHAWHVVTKALRSALVLLEVGLAGSQADEVLRELVEAAASLEQCAGKSIKHVELEAP